MGKSLAGSQKSQVNPRSPGTHLVGSWVTDTRSLCRGPRTGTQHIGSWASRKMWGPPNSVIIDKCHPRVQHVKLYTAACSMFETS